jgi:glycosyltransferase involved in cell wall biosynthesis
VEVKILWYSPTPWVQTGYGQQTYQFVKQLQADGNDVRIVPMNGHLRGSPTITWDGIKVLATGNDRYSVDALLGYTAMWKPDLVISLFDIWALPEDFGIQIKEAGGKWLPITPVDHDPIPKVMVDRLAFAHMPIAMSTFGLKQMRTAGLTKARYIPHAFDSNIFKPKPIRMWSKDKFHVGMVAANVGTYDRKAFQENFQAYAEFHRKHPDSLLYVHSDLEAVDGLDLHALAKEVGIGLVYPPKWQYYQGHSRESMASIYNSMDVLLHCSRAEGFGIPIIEAQACGTPAIGTNFTSMTELSNLLVEPASLVWTPLNSWHCLPGVEGIVERLGHNYDRWKRAWSRASVSHNVQQFSLHNVMESHLYPALEEAQNWPLTDEKNVV